MRRIAIVGGGIAGLAAAYEIAQQACAGAPIEAVLFESSDRLGGIVETVREGGFTIETGPDAWLTAKPWAAELATELGLAAELLPSNDATRKTLLYLHNQLVPMPDGMNLIVPTNLADLESAALGSSSLFTPAAIAAYRAEPSRAAELLASIPPHDESVADFTLRHFGPEVLARIAAPLLAGIFGGDVHTLSAHAVIPGLVQLERTHGSLVAALASQPATNREQPTPALFTTLRTGLGALIDGLVAAIPPTWIRLTTAVSALTPPTPEQPLWIVATSTSAKSHDPTAFDEVFLATPVDATRSLLTPLDPHAAQLLPTQSSSAVLVALCFPDATRVPIPPGFGFLVPPTPPPPQNPLSVQSHRMSGLSSNAGPPSSNQPVSPDRSEETIDSPASPDLVISTEAKRSGETRNAPARIPSHNTSPTLLLACTFTDQKFPHRVPRNGRLIRAFFGGAAAERLARCNNDEVAAIARAELTRILSPNSPHPLPTPTITVVRRWPNSLPQYAVGHLLRTAELDTRLHAFPGLTLLGNALHGVGLPDLIRAARQAARAASSTHRPESNL